MVPDARDEELEGSVQGTDQGQPGPTLQAESGLLWVLLSTSRRVYPCASTGANSEVRWNPSLTTAS